MPFLFNLPVTYEGYALSTDGLVFLNPNTEEFEINWVGLSTGGFAVTELQWADNSNIYPATWVPCDCGFNC